MHLQSIQPVTEQVEAVLVETAQWLERNQQDHDLRAAYTVYISDKGNRAQKESAIKMCEEWLRENEDDDFLFPLYLDIIKSYRNQEKIDDAYTYTRYWLTNPRHREDTRVREKFLEFVLNTGTKDQIKDAIKDTRDWFVEPETKKKHVGNIRVSLLNLIKNKGSDDQVTAEVDDTRSWLGAHSDDTNVRASLLDLVKARCADEAHEGLRNNLFKDYMDWLNENKRSKKATEVRRRFIDYIASTGNVEQKRSVVYDTRSWLRNEGHDAQVQKSLDILERSLQL